MRDHIDSSSIEVDEGRRAFFATVMAGAFAIGTAGTARAQSTTFTDTDLLVLALNLEYLVGELYSYGIYNGPLPSDALLGKGTQGVVVGARPASIAYTSVNRFCAEVAVEDYFHITFLRNTLRSDVVAQPQIDLSGGTSGPFTLLARAGGAIGPDDTFDPYESAQSFLTAAMVLKDMMVAFYLGIAPLYTNPILRNVALGRIGGHAYAAGTIRAALYRYGSADPAVMKRVTGFANAIGALSPSTGYGQSVAAGTINGQSVANVTPLDRTGSAYTRSATQTLNLAFLTRASTTFGGFFPNGLNANLRVSAAL